MAKRVRPGGGALLGHPFRDPALLERALTPPSTGLADHNQRLEFLGDALLSAAVAALVHREKPDWDEGELSKLRGVLVRRESLLAWAEEDGLPLREGPRSPRGTAGRDNALADALEAVLGALFLDVEAAGGDAFRAVEAVVEGRFLAQVRAARPGGWARHDSKTALQERVARLGFGPPAYALVDRAGPDHAPRFEVQVEAGGRTARAVAGSIKKAEADAARLLLGQLEDPAPSPLSSTGKLG